MNKLVLGLGNAYKVTPAEEIKIFHEVGWDGFFSGWREGEDIESYAKLADELGMFYQSVHAPSWLYSVNHGATTMWEHWNSIKEDGSFWSDDMNSFNHYAYGCVGDWMYAKICGIDLAQGGYGYKKITVAPNPCRRLGFARGYIDTVSGKIESAWYYRDNIVNFEIVIPDGTEATIKLPNGVCETVCGGRYCYIAEALD